MRYVIGLTLHNILVGVRGQRKKKAEFASEVKMHIFNEVKLQICQD